MVTNQMSALFKQALTTFTCKKDIFNQNLELLREVLNKTTAEDVDLNPRFMQNDVWAKENKAPVTYIDIFEDDKLSMGVFILKPNMKLPLHDHPQMYGAIKVLAGKIKITSFSLDTINTIREDSNRSPSFNSCYPNLVTVEKDDETIADLSTECSILDPARSNIHEIESLDGPAAFLDILSPPYETLIDDIGLRKCTYFKVLKQVAPQIFWLGEVGPPSWYWSDCYPYTGLQLST